jgi:hypothetical protein
VHCTTRSSNCVLRMHADMQREIENSGATTVDAESSDGISRHWLLPAPGDHVTARRQRQRIPAWKRDGAQRRPPTVYRKGSPGGNRPNLLQCGSARGPSRSGGDFLLRTATVAPDADASSSEAETSGSGSAPSGTVAGNGGAQGPALRRPVLGTTENKRGGSR